MIFSFFQKIFILVFFALIFYFGFFHFSQIDSIELKMDPSFKLLPANKKNQKKIKDHLNLYKGKSILKVSLKDLMREVKKIHPVGDVYIVRRWPNRIIVFLEKDEPIALLLKDGEDFFFVSYNGEIRYKLDYSQSLNYPILRGKYFWKNKELRKRAVEFLSFLPKEGYFISDNISEIKYNKKNDSLILYLIPKNFVVEWKGLLVSRKIQNINFVLNYMKEGEHPRYHVDARFDKKIIVNKSK